jgi:hypothetical protein
MTARILFAALVLGACSKPEQPALLPPPAPAPVALVVPDAGSDASDASVDAPPDAGLPLPRRPAKRAAAAPASGGGSGGFKVEGKLAKEEVEKIVRAGMPKLRACYVAAHAKQPDLKGRVLFKLTVDHRGSVALGEVVNSTLGGGDPEMCMVQAARDLRFPRSDGESTVGFQMAFK